MNKLINQNSAIKMSDCFSLVESQLAYLNQFFLAFLSEMLRTDKQKNEDCILRAQKVIFHDLVQI